MAYTVIRSFYEGDVLHQEGSSFQHQDEAYIQKCLADGNIADSESEVAAERVAEQPAVEEDPAPAAPLEEVQPGLSPESDQPSLEEVQRSAELEGSKQEINIQ